MFPLPPLPPFEIPDCPAYGQSGTGAKNKLKMPEPVRFRLKPTQSGIFLVRCRTEIMDADVSFLDADAPSKQLCFLLNKV
jgi:hypothetical protein